MREGFPIGRLARETGVKPQTIRWYEETGLLPPPARTPGNQRVYGSDHAARLAFIRHARELGFPLADVREMLELVDQPERPCAAVDEIARRHLESVRRRLARLRGLEAELERMVAECRGGRVAECRIVEVLSDDSHAHCLSDAHARESGQRPDLEARG